MTKKDLLITLIREVGTKAKTVQTWNEAISLIACFTNLTPEDAAWLEGVRWMGAYTRPYTD